MQSTTTLTTIPKPWLTNKLLIAAIHKPELLEECAQTIMFNDVLLGSVTGQLSETLATNDLEREAVFVEQTSEGVAKILHQLINLGIPYQRPDDYFAEMVKEDSHMKKIQEKLAAEKERLEKIQRRKEERAAAKHAKQQQVEIEKEKKKQTKQFHEKVAQVKKERLKQRAKKTHSLENAFTEDDDDDFPVESILDVEELPSREYFSKKGKSQRKKVAVSRGVINKRKPQSRYFSSKVAHSKNSNKPKNKKKR
eukprot:jgi/Galph1/675/GphlegSOOS_G5299.1